MCVLTLLSNKDSYGYEIFQEVNSILTISESTIYPILRRFVKSYYCETYVVVANEGKPPRKYFKLTNLGISRCTSIVEEYRKFNDKIDIMLNKYWKEEQYE